ncbi:MAG: DegT/DnrJ/EryC1/StrS family aminotransferase [Chitinophagales bacterium]
MRKIQMVDLQSQYAEIRQDVDRGIQAVIDSSQFINGTATKEFTAALAKYLETPYMVPCANGTDALQIALMAIGLQPGDEVITIPFTFVATVEVVALLKGVPVFVDIKPDTFTIDPAQISAKITPRTKAIIPVHLFGQCSDMEEIMEIGRAHNIPVIEDNAQAIGATYTMRNGTVLHAGTLGAIGTTSFYPTKNLGAYGDGGALWTGDEALYKAMRIICDHGSARKYYYDSIGINSRLDSIQAAILHAKLPHLNAYNAKRQAAAAQYDAWLRDVPGVIIPVRNAASTHVFHQYTLRILSGRDALQEYLRSKEIPSMIYYPVPLHLSDAYAIYGYKPGDFPVSEQMAAEVLSLPMHTELDAEQIQYICNHIADFMHKQNTAKA